MSKRVSLRLILIFGLILFSIFSRHNDVFAEVVSSTESEQLDFAHALRERKLYDMSVLEYQKFINNYPKSIRLEEAYFGVAESYFLMDSTDKSIEAFNKFKELFPSSKQFSAAALRLAQIYFNQGIYDQCLKNLSVVEISSLSGQMKQNYYFYSAKAKRAQGEIDQAKAELLQAINAADATLYTANAMGEMGDICLLEQNYIEAADYYLKAFNTTADAELKSYFLFKQGQANFSAGQYSLSASVYEDFLAQFPNSSLIPDAISNLLFGQFNLSHFEDVLALFDKYQSLIQLNVSFFSTYYGKASAQIELAQLDNALKTLDEILTIPELPTTDQLKTNSKKAEVMIKQTRYQPALDLLNTLEENAENIFLKAKAHYGAGRIKEATEYYQSVSQKFQNSDFAKPALWGAAQAQFDSGMLAESKEGYLSFYETAVNEQLAGEAIYNVILIDDQMKMIPQAIEHSKLYLSKFPQGSYKERITLLLGEFYAKNKEYALGINLLQEYLKQPENIQDINAVYFLLAYNYQSAGQLEEAVNQYAKVTYDEKSSNRYYSAALKNSAQINVDQKNYEAGAALFDQLIMKVNPSAVSIQTYLWISQQYLREKKYDDLLRVNAQAASAFPKQEKQAIAYFQAEAYRGLNNCPKALDFYREVTSVNEKNNYAGASLIGQGLCLMQSEQFKQAANAFSDALSQYPDDNTITMRARYETARALEAQQKMDEALRFYLLVTTLYDDPVYSPQALLRAGDLFLQKGDREQALSSYREIVTDYPESEFLQESYQRIKGLEIKN